MRPARHLTSMLFILLLCACAQNPASHDAMIDQLVCSALEESDMQLFHDSIGWHREVFDHEALFRMIGS